MCRASGISVPDRFKIHFLIGEPRQPGTEGAFQNALHLLGKMPGQKQLVREHEIEGLASHVAEEITSYVAEEMVLKDKTKKA